MKIYKRIYDSPKDKNGNIQPNEYLGDYDIIEVLYEDFYSSQRIGTKDGKVFLISEYEVSGRRDPYIGGSRFEVKELKTLRVI